MFESNATIEEGHGVEYFGEKEKNKNYEWNKFMEKGTFVKCRCYRIKS